METIHSRLRSWRWQQARELNVPSFFILSNAHLEGVAAAMPTTMEELAQCKGIGPRKLEQFGTQLVEQVARGLADGLQPGVSWPEPPSPPEPSPLSDEEVAAIAAELRHEMAQRLARRLKGRFSAEQVEEALQRIAVTA